MQSSKFVYRENAKHTDPVWYKLMSSKNAKAVDEPQQTYPVTEYFLPGNIVLRKSNERVLEWVRLEIPESACSATLLEVVLEPKDIPKNIHTILYVRSYQVEFPPGSQGNVWTELSDQEKYVCQSETSLKKLLSKVEKRKVFEKIQTCLI